MRLLNSFELVAVKGTILNFKKNLCIYFWFIIEISMACDLSSYNFPHTITMEMLKYISMVQWGIFFIFSVNYLGTYKRGLMLIDINNHGMWTIILVYLFSTTTTLIWHYVGKCGAWYWICLYLLCRERFATVRCVCLRIFWHRNTSIDHLVIKHKKNIQRYLE